MRRRAVLAGTAALAAVASHGLSAPAIAQGRRQLRMVTDWPDTLPGLFPSAVRLAKTIQDSTGGRIEIQVFAAGALVRPFETFDAVSAGVADMFHTALSYFEKKAPALNYFTAIPFGFTAAEEFAWVQHGGGQAIFDELCGRYGIKPLLACNTGCQMGGWFTQEISSPEGFKGLRYRMPGPGAEVLRRLGAIVVLLPVGEIGPALASGALDASEFIGPWTDMSIGLHKAARYYYYPGFHEPSSAHTLGVNRRVWDGLDASDRHLIEAAAAAEYARGLAEYDANNARALRKLRDEGQVKILRFDDSVLTALARISKDVVAEIGATDDVSRRIHASYEAFRSLILDWSDIADRAFLNARALG